MRYAFGEDSNPEWWYILGDFGVRIEGNTSVITSKPEKLSFGSWTQTGFPFYGGNITYHFNIAVPDNGDYEITAGRFRAPLLKVFVDGIEIGNIAYAPFNLELGHLDAGIHD